LAIVCLIAADHGFSYRNISRSRKMKSWHIALAVAAVVLTVLIAQTQAADQGADVRGRYEGVNASVNAVWVIDTRSGTVRKCTQEFADQAPACSAMSN